MARESWVDKNHFRRTSDDGRTSYLYRTDGWFDYCEEIAEHHPDGTTDAYEVDDSILGQLFGSGKGSHK
jgi:hypothetical protein